MESFARCIRGIEWIAAAEIEARMGATITGVRHREVRFDTRDRGRPDELLGLRTVDDVFATVLVVDGIGHRRAELTRMADALSNADLDAGLEGRGGRAATIEVVGSFLGRRNFSRFELEDALGPGLGEASGARYLSRAGGVAPAADLTYRAHLDGDELVIGRRLARQPLHRRDYKGASGPGSLHPPLAAAMVLLAGIEPGGCLLDPFCGAGTILAEAVGWEPSLRAVGLDRSSDALVHAADNTAGSAAVSLVRADAACPPTRREAVDRVVTNPPWGGQAPFLGRAGRDTIVAVVDDVRVGDGHAVVLVDEPLDAQLEWSAPPNLTLVVGLFGRHPRLHLFHPGAGPLPDRGRWVESLGASLDSLGPA